MDKKDNKKKYCSPAVNDTATVLTESVLLSESRLVGSSFIIEGQEVGGYFENDDITSTWE